MLFLQYKVASFGLEFCPVNKPVCFSVYSLSHTHSHTYTLAKTGSKPKFPASEAAAKVGFI